MSGLTDHVHDYLTMRRSLGFKLVFEGHVLPQLAAHVEAAGASTVTTELAIAWAGIPGDHVLPISLAHRLGAARGFARYLRTIDGIAEIPPTGVWPGTTPRPQPYIWTHDEIRRLLDAARLLSPLRAVTHETLFGLLAATGMRIGEAIGLDRRDIDVDAAVITIRDAKFGRTRLVPIHRSTGAALAAYTARRNALSPDTTATAFFVTTTGTPLRYGGVRQVFNELTAAIGLRTPTSRPRVHDLRHTFAVRTLIDWHRAGVDIDGRLPVLSTYLGHVNPSGTYWYLTAAPELMELAAARLNRGSRR